MSHFVLHCYGAFIDLRSIPEYFTMDAVDQACYAPLQPKRGLKMQVTLALLTKQLHLTKILSLRGTLQNEQILWFVQKNKLVTWPPKAKVHPCRHRQALRVGGGACGMSVGRVAHQGVGWGWCVSGGVAHQ